MNTVLRASPKGFVSTPAVERIAVRGLRYLQSGFSVHLRGPAGTGKTTLALHLADLLGRPIMLIFGDDELKSSDMIGNQLGYTHKKVVDNYIHSVVKVEDEMRQNWIDSRLTLACREGFTLVYDEFNRSRPEVNNVLLSALEEKLLVLPPNAQRSEYVRVHPQFRAIFTSNPEEYCGVHGTQDALMDRLVTISMLEPDEMTQMQILVQKIGIEREEAARIVQFVKAFRKRADSEKSSGLRACLRIAKVCREHAIPTSPENADFRDICTDVLLSRTKLEMEKATKLLWEIFDEFSAKWESSVLENLVGNSVGENVGAGLAENLIVEPLSSQQKSPLLEEMQTTSVQNSSFAASIQQTTAIQIPPIPELELINELPNTLSEERAIAQFQENQETLIPPPEIVAYEREIYAYLLESQGAKVSEIEAALQINRVQTIDALRSLIKKDVLKQRDNRLFVDRGDN